MTDKELKRLKRDELIEIIYQYQSREKRLAYEINRLQSELTDKRIRIERAGSIAEAALSLNGVFERAQSAADQYVQELEAALQNSNEIAKGIIDAAEAEAKILRQNTEKRCEDMKRAADEYCAEVKQRIYEYAEKHRELAAFFNNEKSK